MIRYEILSNAASSDQGLQHHPQVQGLVETLRLEGIEARVVRQVHREEDQINLARGQFARGVTARATAVKETPPETHLKGCLAWLRATAGRIDRGLHCQVESPRATNGTGLILRQLYERGHKVFLSGLEEGGGRRLMIQCDPSLTEVPRELAQMPEVKADYLARATRANSFFPVLERMVRLGFVPQAIRARFQTIVRARDAAAVAGLSEAEVANSVLISEALERYERLLEQFFAYLYAGEVGGDLGPYFELLTQGVPFPRLREALLPFTLEAKRAGIDNRRTLANEVRIGLGQSEQAVRSRFERGFTSLVLEQRLLQDPPLYRRAVVLPQANAEESEAIQPARERFLALRPLLEALPADGAQPLPPAVSERVFELVVTLVFLSEFTVKHRTEVLPSGPNLARQLLTCLVFNAFDVRRLRSINPNLPARGVARNLAGKVPLTVGEVRDSLEMLGEALFPLGQVATELARTIAERFRDEATQRRTRELNLYLGGAYPLLGFTNYVLGRSGLTPVMRAGALAAGRGLGLVMLESRDEIRNRDVLERRDGAADEEAVRGYVVLLNRDDDRLLPLRSQPDHLARAYQYLFTDRLVGVVRRLVTQKVVYLYDRYGDGLFEHIYQHVAWERQLPLSRHQLAAALSASRVFDLERLREFGYRREEEEHNAQGTNRWLAYRFDAGEEGGGQHPFAAQRVEQVYKGALQQFHGLVQGYRERARTPGGQGSLEAALARAAEQGGFGLAEPATREALAASDAAARLWELLGAAAAANLPLLRQAQAEGDAAVIELPGPLAFLSLLRPAHTVAAEDGPLPVRLVPAWEGSQERLDAASRAMVTALTAHLQGVGKAEGELAQVMGVLQRHWRAWGQLVQVSALVLIDQMLGETILTYVKPAPPLPGELSALPPGQVMCLGTSSMDQGKFHKVVANPEAKGVYATISEMASWLHRFQRLREELEGYRAVIDDILGIIDGFGFSPFDAPHLTRLARQFQALSAALDVSPEDLTWSDLTAMETRAREVTELVREIFDQERSLRLRDRWLGRVAIRLRAQRANTPLTFAQQLFERGQAEPPPEGDEAAAEERRTGTENYQTFSERVRNIIELREQLGAKQVFVISPANTQHRITITVIDRLFRLKGLDVPIFADISRCESFVDALRRRLPPHRLFNLNRL